MSPERWHRIESLFLTAIERTPAERTAFLDDACADDEALHRQLRSLLSHYEEDPSFLETSFAGLPITPDAPTPSLSKGEHLGPYRLIQSLGRGGMGTVYLAERADGAFEQQVAIKILRRGLDTEDVLRRFRAERSILASLHHPHIARLLDGGTTEDGRPYFVMEYVEGTPLTAYCDAHRLPISARLQLFQQVCAAVQVAHRNLIIHRDLKPSNILVATGSEGEPDVKLLDFGIAKMLDPSRVEHSVPHTRPDLHVLTPAYASPEQIRGASLTTASDVYALGIVLYELLTGRRPYTVPPGSWSAAERIICEVEPEPPSAAVTHPHTVAHHDGATETITPEEVSEARNTPPDRLHRQLNGDLDNIVMKALRKAPDARYASVERCRRTCDVIPTGCLSPPDAPPFPIACGNSSAGTVPVWQRQRSSPCFSSGSPP